MKYRIYIDETGSSDLQSSDNPNHRFLCLTGVALALDHVEQVVYPQMEALKAKYFQSHPDEPVVFHRKEMMNRRMSFRVLTDDQTRLAFDAELLHYMREWDYTVISICLDKKAHREAYQVWRYDPYHYCLKILLERYVFFLDGKHGKGDVMSESRGGKEDVRIKESFERLWLKGTDFVPAERFQSVLTSRQLKCKPKANNIAGLQLADLIAHPSRDEILNENGFKESDLASFSKQIIDILRSKYYQRNGIVYGKKFIGEK
jgi:hypothetical protein